MKKTKRIVALSMFLAVASVTLLNGPAHASKRCFPAGSGRYVCVETPVDPGDVERILQ